MNDLLKYKINSFSTYTVDKNSTNIINTKSLKEVNVEDFLEISHVLDSSYFSYTIDQHLNFIDLDKI